MALPLFASFSAMLLLTVLTSIVSTPANIIADAAVMAASTHVGRWLLAGGAGGPGGRAGLLPAAALDNCTAASHASQPTHLRLGRLPCLQPGDYGRLRTWASFAWTAFAPLAGWVNSSFGIRWVGKLEGGTRHCRAMGLSSGAELWLSSG
jgi:hypothetical protein